MAYLYIKIIIAILLSAIPFLFAIFIKPKTKDGKWKNVFTLSDINSEKVANGAGKIRKFIMRIYEAMKYSDNARKFFIMLLIITMIVVQWIDSEATQTAVKAIIGNRENVHLDKESMIKFFPFITSPIVTILSMIYTLILFRYKWSNKLLTKIGTSKKVIVLFVAMIMLSIVIGSGRFFLLGEILFLTLIWALILPKKKGEGYPDGGTRIKRGKKTEKYDMYSERKAA